MLKVNSPDRVQEFEHPLKYHDPVAIRQYRAYALRQAGRNIGIGASLLFIVVLIGALSDTQGGSAPRSGGLGTFAGIGLIYSLYGFLQLATLRNRMADRARALLLAKYPELVDVGYNRKQKIARNSDLFLKIFTFGLSGILVIAAAIYATYQFVYN